MIEKSTILIVDDTPLNIAVLAGALRNNYKIKVATNGLAAIKIAQIQPPPSLILLDIMMPELDGYEVCRTLKALPNTKHIPIVFVTANTSIEDEIKGLQLGAVDYITKPINPPIAIQRIKTQLALVEQHKELYREVKNQTEEINNAKIELIHRLGRAAEYKDNETGLHVIRVAHYSYLIAKAYGINDVDADLLLDAAPMHDIGKIGIPDHILLKPGALDKDEWKVMKKHVDIGDDLLMSNFGSNSELLSLAQIVVMTHHEKYNGQGYPNGLKGEDIPLVGRIVAIADVFDALTSERPYKKAMTLENAFNIIESEKGEHFDPLLAQLFLDSREKIESIMKQFNEFKKVS